LSESVFHGFLILLERRFHGIRSAALLCNEAVDLRFGFRSAPLQLLQRNVRCVSSALSGLSAGIGGLKLQIGNVASGKAKNDKGASEGRNYGISPTLQRLGARLLTMKVKYKFCVGGIALISFSVFVYRVRSPRSRCRASRTSG